jgi:hypothetical protein
MGFKVVSYKEGVIVLQGLILPWDTALTLNPNELHVVCPSCDGKYTRKSLHEHVAACPIRTHIHPLHCPFFVMTPFACSMQSWLWQSRGTDQPEAPRSR